MQNSIVNNEHKQTQRNPEQTNKMVNKLFAFFVH